MKCPYTKYRKLSKIVPLHKKSDKTNGENYWPISNIIFISQVCEKAVLRNHFNKTGLFHPHNHGVRPDHYTLTALSQLHDMWIKAADKHEISAALILNLSAAFDLVDLVVLLGKLRLYGLNQSAEDWFSLYFRNQMQYVQVEAQLSNPKPTGDQGVPITSDNMPTIGLTLLYSDDDTE